MSYITIYVITKYLIKPRAGVREKKKDKTNQKWTKNLQKLLWATNKIAVKRSWNA